MPRDFRAGFYRRLSGKAPSQVQLKGPRLSLIAYTPDRFFEKTDCCLEDCMVSREAEGVRWINVDGLSDPQLLEKLMGAFGIHPLVLEDVMALEQRPKLEDYGEYLFAVLNMLTLDKESGSTVSEQVSVILGKGFVISVQENPGDVFDTVRERLRSGRGRLRKMGSDALAYSLFDAVVDGYFIVLENLSDRVEALEDELVGSPNRETLQSLHGLRSELNFVRRCVWPLRELIGNLERRDSPLLDEALTPYLRDLYDHTVQVLESVESLRETLSGFLDIYLSSLSNRMNEIMKVLTVISTLFIPLTFIAGVYGMNFRTMPELEWPWGYPLVLGAMAGIAAVMLRYFRRKGWV
jgi:magnesium transporter